ncbi:beta-lactamase family protein [Shewanella sp. Isolate13]|uniref:serine hydrolase domain-containing protein n=1 Tax=Shewanella sp. Isolate13 TaxID=2908531 RepID=UPI001EFD04B4|nr:serine hydrolase [Shewanella sp. Isolate13]MCG9729132.1 beta-lactamase family protein [Shewanella sp. Isolate13]
MKKRLINTLIGIVISTQIASVNAVEFKPVDTEFVSQAAAFAVTQDNWDQAANAAVTFPHAYRFTRHMAIAPANSNPVEPWREAPIELLSLKANDLDGPHSLEVLLRDRLKNHSMVVLNNGKLAHQHFFNDYGPEQTHLQMSVTKSFTSILAAISVAEGKLDMSRPIVSYLPELIDSGFEDTTVQEVADMRSGIGVKFTQGKLWDDRMTEAQDWNGNSKYPNMRSIMDYAKTLDNHRPIGKVYDYLDINTELLGKVVEKVQGKPLAEVFAAKLWHKIDVETPARWMANRNGEVVASGGLNITTRDLARVGQVIINGGKNMAGEQVIPTAFIESLMQGNDKVRHAWRHGKESKLAKGWYQDQFRVLYLPNSQGKTYKVLAMVGIHGQILVMDLESQTVIAMNSGFGDMEPPRMALMIFKQIIPAILDAMPSHSD